MKPLVYVAGPFRRPDPIANTHRAVREGMALWDSGRVAVLIPHLTLVAHLVEPRADRDWLDFDLDQLEHCHAVLRLPGESAGADAEVARAHELGLPVFHHRGEVVAWVASTEGLAPDP